MTGDFITSSSSVYSSLKDTLEGNEKENVINCLTSGQIVPDPVFFCSVEAPSPSYETALDKALKELAKEDPSLKITTNNETKQTVLGGMGELHLEIIKERIRKDYKIKVEYGPIQIAYKETILKNVKDNFVTKHQMGNIILDY